MSVAFSQAEICESFQEIEVKVLNLQFTTKVLKMIRALELE